METIMISGKQGSGKTTTREKLIEELLKSNENLEIKYLKLADPIYGSLRILNRFLGAWYLPELKEKLVDDLALTFMGYIQLEYPTMFEMNKDYKVYSVLAQWVFDNYSEEELVMKSNKELFYLMKNVSDTDGKFFQYFGTEFGRNMFHRDIWVMCLQDTIEKSSKVKIDYTIIDDLRFKNEFDAFPDAIKIRLIAPEDIRKSRAEKWRDTVNHQSEIDLDEYECDNKFDMYFDTDSESTETIVSSTIKAL